MTLETSIKKLSNGRGMAVLIYGASGTGKTSCVRNLNPQTGAIITTEPDGLEALANFGWDTGNFIVVDSAQDFGEALHQAVTSSYTWLCIDSISGYYDILWDNYMKENKLAPDDVSFRTFGYCMNIMQDILMRIMDCVEAGKTVILLCHQKDVREEGAGFASVSTAPDLPGKLPEKICRKMTMVLRTNKLDVGGTTRYFLCNPSGRDVGKDMTGQITKPVDNDIAPFLRLPTTTAQKKGITLSVPRKERPPKEEKKEKKERLVVLENPSPGTPPNGKTISKAQMQYALELAKEAGIDTRDVQKIVKQEFGKKLNELVDDELGKLTVQLTGVIDAKAVAKADEKEPW